MLDILLSVLDENLSEDSDGMDISQNDNQGLPVNNEMIDAAVPILHDQIVLDPPAEEQHVLQPSPPVSYSPLRRYLSSGSARRRLKKPSNCCFCRMDLEGAALEQHLRGNDLCFTLYKRRHHCNSVDGVLVKVYDNQCMFCLQPYNRLDFHLETNPNCKDQYFAKFHLQSIRYNNSIFTLLNI